MSQLTRFGVSLEKGLLKKFDALIAKRNYTNRSEALRDLIRQALVNEQWQKGADVAGAITLVYDHHHRDLMHRITDIQHDCQKVIISTQHIHLDHHNCLEIIAVMGKAENVRMLADSLQAVKGVKHTSLNMSSSGKEF